MQSGAAPSPGLAFSGLEGVFGRRRGGEWETVGMAMETETTLNNQERGKKLECRFIAANKADEGEASNAVMGSTGRKDRHHSARP